MQKLMVSFILTLFVAVLAWNTIDLLERTQEIRANWNETELEYQQNISGVEEETLEEQVTPLLAIFGTEEVHYYTIHAYYYKSSYQNYFLEPEEYPPCS